jgi:zinc transport system ATP-binding protein
MEKLIEIKNITASYETQPVFRDVSLTLWENDFLGIIGPNGGGKTTLLKVILGLLKPVEGSMVFYENGKETPSLRIGYLPQINRIDKRFPISVYEVVASGLMARKRRFRGYSIEQRRQTEAVINQMGLTGMEKRPIGELSGGELQRVLLGRAIVSRPQVLALDEPNTYVDKAFETHLYEALKEINRDTAVILVSHDIQPVLPMVKNMAYVNKSLRYRPGNNLNELSPYGKI